MLNLTRLIGTWQGEGSGQFPTIEAFRFKEVWQVSGQGDSGLVHYEQRTHLLPDDRPSHWESGFLLQGEGGVTHWTYADNSGRFGIFVQTHFSQEAEDVWEWHLETVQAHNDARVTGLKRQITCRDNHLHYAVFMTTTTTSEPGPHCHLEADLYRQKG